MAAKYIIFDGHIPVVFPEPVSTRSVMHAMIDHSVAKEVTGEGCCFYDPLKGWKCLNGPSDFALELSKQHAEILNRHLCN